MATLPNVRLDLSNRPENVLLVREALTGVAESVGLDGSDLSDVRTAVTEACNNVVLHAYRGAEGPLEVEVDVAAGLLEVVVRDRGVGMRLEAMPPEPSVAAESGIGLPVIEALTQAVEFSAPPDGGTEVRMRFATPDVRGMETATGDADAPPGDHEREPGATASLLVGPVRLARAVVPRLLCVLAARAQFSTDRISDSQLLADALVAHAAAAIDGSHLKLTVNVEPRDLEVCVGPLIAGRAERLVLDSDVEGLGPVLEKLADGHDVSSSDSYDTLTLTLHDRAAAR
jgi:anti-sigma regulatory factor (Ser/Thr protein kinase)